MERINHEVRFKEDLLEDLNGHLKDLTGTLWIWVLRLNELSEYTFVGEKNGKIEILINEKMKKKGERAFVN